MSWPSAAALTDLVARFRARTLPKAEWTHQAHLAVGAWHVQTYGADDAMRRLRDGIRALNRSHGTANTDSSGYHETITQAYVVLLDDFLQRAGGDDLAGRVRALMQSPLASREALLTFYSKPRLFSVDARRGWLPPDLQPLPVHTGVGSISRFGRAE